MDRDVALRMDGMLTGLRGNIDHLAHFMKNNLSTADYQKYIQHVGHAMADMVEISKELYEEHPDILPEELTPM